MMCGPKPFLNSLWKTHKCPLKNKTKKKIGVIVNWLEIDAQIVDVLYTISLSFSFSFSFMHIFDTICMREQRVYLQSDRRVRRKTINYNGEREREHQICISSPESRVQSSESRVQALSIL